MKEGINKKKMRIFALFFCCNLADNRRVRVRLASQNKIRPKDFRGAHRSDFREEPVNFCESKKRGANPSAPCNGKFNCRIGNCYTSLDFYPQFYFLICFLWHTKSNGFNRKHGFLYSPYFWKHGLLYIPF